MSNLVVILGAGFSFPAGLPLANDIKKRFNRVQKEKLLLASSSEWMWIDDKDDASVNNGSLGFDHLAYSYILNEIVKERPLSQILDLPTDTKPSKTCNCFFPDANRQV